jgi:DNA ligase-associated metallophosphoesterase
MSGYAFSLAGVQLVALGSGALHWPEAALLCVSDLHLGKTGHAARQGAAALPPFETRDTLLRLQADLDATGARTVVCLGDSFDDSADALPESEQTWIARLQAGRSWIWIAGNHDPGPVSLGGSHLAELPRPPLCFRHIAQARASGEVSGHYHPMARTALRGHSVAQPCFLLDGDRMILPAYGGHTGGLDCRDPALARLMRPEALAILTGAAPLPVPMPRAR